MSLLQEYYTQFPDQRKAHMNSPLQDHKFLPSNDELSSTDQLKFGVSPEVKGAEVLTLLRKGTWDSVDAEEEAWPCSWPPVTQFPKAPRQMASSNNIEEHPIPRQRATAARAVPTKIDSDFDYQSPSPSPIAGNGFAAESPGSGHKEKDKEWAALTTWLRMNLHQPRTVKRKVLFVGAQPSDEDEEWVFDLNEAITWDDVSIDTKTRLKTLVEETEAAFAQKYPNRRVSDWKYKIQKYRLPGGSKTHLVPLADVVYSLQDIYNRHAGASGAGNDSGGEAGPAGMDMDDEEMSEVPPARFAPTPSAGVMMSSSMPASSHNWGGRMEQRGAGMASRLMRRIASHSGLGGDDMTE